jgi:hypothetical protein
MRGYGWVAAMPATGILILILAIVAPRAEPAPARPSGVCWRIAPADVQETSFGYWILPFDLTLPFSLAQKSPDEFFRICKPIGGAPPVFLAPGRAT